MTEGKKLTKEELEVVRHKVKFPGMYHLPSLTDKLFAHITALEGEGQAVKGLLKAHTANAEALLKEQKGEIERLIETIAGVAHDYEYLRTGKGGYVLAVNDLADSLKKYAIKNGALKQKVEERQEVIDAYNGVLRTRDEELKELQALIEKMKEEMPWKELFNKGWRIVGMNHYHAKGESYLFCSMTKEGKCITAEALWDANVFRMLNEQACTEGEKKSHGDYCNCEKCLPSQPDRMIGHITEDDKKKPYRERVEYLKKKAHPYKDPFVAENDELMFLINLIDKQEKVIEVAKEYNLYSIADVDRKFKIALAELEGENEGS